MPYIITLNDVTGDSCLCVYQRKLKTLEEAHKVIELITRKVVDSNDYTDIKAEKIDKGILKNNLIMASNPYIGRVTSYDIIKVQESTTNIILSTYDHIYNIDLDELQKIHENNRRPNSRTVAYSLISRHNSPQASDRKLHTLIKHIDKKYTPEEMQKTQMYNGVNGYNIYTEAYGKTDFGVILDIPLTFKQEDDEFYLYCLYGRRYGVWETLKV